MHVRRLALAGHQPSSTTAWRCSPSTSGFNRCEGMSHHRAVTVGRYLADVATGSGPPTRDTGQATTPASTGADVSQRKRSPRSDSGGAWLRSSVWPWPALAVTAIALAGYLFGWLGAVVVAGQTVATLLFVAGDSLLDSKKRTWLTVSAVAAGSVVVIILLWQAHAIGLLRSRTAGEARGSANLVGRTLTQTMVEGLNLRGAMLSGAELDHLSLVGKSLNGAIAPGSSFIGTNLQRVPMRGGEFPGANFSGACLRDADLAGAELDGANVAGADITGTGLPHKVVKTLVGKPAPSGTHVRSCH
jgi:Pentapeptide repeats (8 copies)